MLTGTVAAGAGACYDGGEDGGLAGGTSGGKHGDVAARVGDVLGWCSFHHYSSLIALGPPEPLLEMMGAMG